MDRESVSERCAALEAAVLFCFTRFLIKETHVNLVVLSPRCKLLGFEISNAKRNKASRKA